MKLNRCAVQRDGDIDCLDGPFVADLFVADRSAGRHALKCNRFDRRSDRPLFSPVGVLSGVPVRSAERSTTLLVGRNVAVCIRSIGGAIDHLGSQPPTATLRVAIQTMLPHVTVLVQQDLLDWSDIRRWIDEQESIDVPHPTERAR